MPTPATAQVPPDRIAAVRHFNRFYTREIGVLEEGMFDSPFSLAEVRVLYEVAHRDGPSAAEVARDLHLDPGYASRILRRFRKDGFVTAKPSAADGRRTVLALTARGRQTMKTLEARSNAAVTRLLSPLAASDQRRCLQAMRTIQRLLGAAIERPAPVVLRPPEPGDLGWIVHRQGALYAQEYGYDDTFEALAATIVGEFGKAHDARNERCWIAEYDAEVVGSVFIVRKSDDIAKLRLLYVEPSARGLGIGGRLIDECVRFARGRKYKTLTLWTQSHLAPARRLYERAGFVKTRAEAHHSFGKDLVGETWDLTL
jgi:DNA-binding MarR family transcriptional regulator/ribosomal protein S18 acetylase RimI-like enzyme